MAHFPNYTLAVLRKTLRPVKLKKEGQCLHFPQGDHRQARVLSNFYLIQKEIQPPAGITHSVILGWYLAVECGPSDRAGGPSGSYHVQDPTEWGHQGTVEINQMWQRVDQAGFEPCLPWVPWGPEPSYLPLLCLHLIPW